MIRITLLMLLLAVSAQAQVTLEKDYTIYSGIQIHHIEDVGSKYVGFDSTTKRVMIYNSNHSTWKTISLTSATYSSYITPTYVSSKLFDLDQDVEFIITDTNGVKIVNENGNVVKLFSKADYANVWKFDNTYKLLVYYLDAPRHTEVYSLPGKYPTGLMKPGIEDPEATLYPNPVTHSAVLEYNLPNGSHTGTIGVYNMNGILMRQYQVTDQFDNVIIERGDLPAGMYTYQLQSQGQGVTTGKFTVQ